MEASVPDSSVIFILKIVHPCNVFVNKKKLRNLQIKKINK